MKKQDPFSGIPAVPNSLAGQWLAFNHMANHYRKLLNVKPRVDSAAPRIASHNNILQQQNISSHLTSSKGMQQSGTNSKPKKAVKNANKKQTRSTRLTINKETNPNLNKPVTCRYQYNSDFADSPQSSPRSETIKHSPRKSIDKNYDGDLMSCELDYEVLFGPSSFKSSTDALVSDCDSQSEEPRVEMETIGVAEKIHIFLKQLHKHNTNTKKPPPPSPNIARKPSIALVQSKQPKVSIPIKGTLTKMNIAVEPKLSRHSKCFLPCSSNENSPKKVVKKPPTPLNARAKLSEAIGKAKMDKSLESKAKSKTMANIRRNASGESRGNRAMVKGGSRIRYLSGGSGGSVGTIRGSDELTAEDLLEVKLPPKRVPISQESPNSLKQFTSRQRNKSGILRSSSTGYCSQSLSGKATSLSSLGLINNKDSSRDSAYGFSSGESRITTRESTPEKTHATPYHNINKTKSKKSLDKNNNKYKSTLSTVASSVNLDATPVTNLGFQVPKEKRKSPRSLDQSGDRYLNFLTDITEDIVNRGIYTNKGLKILFKAHLENHKGLDPNKMEDMLDKLRMDLGIPKDDTLNKLEFGYGSVLYTTDSYFYTKGTPCIPEKVHPSCSKGKSLLSRKNERSRLVENARQLSCESNSSSDRLANCSEGDNQSSKSGNSLSDTELRMTLKEAGLDSETALEIVHIMHQKDIHSSDDSEYNHPSLSRNKPSLETHKGHRRRLSARSESPPSRCSTGSS